MHFPKLINVVVVIFTIFKRESVWNLIDVYKIWLICFVENCRLTPLNRSSMYNSLDWENLISLIMGKGTEMDIISLLSGWWSLQGNDSSCLKRRRKEIKKKVKVWISVVQHFLCNLENTRLKLSVGVALHLFWKLKNTRYCTTKMIILQNFARLTFWPF